MRTNKKNRMGNRGKDRVDCRDKRKASGRRKTPFIPGKERFRDDPAGEEILAAFLSELFGDGGGSGNMTPMFGVIELDPETGLAELKFSLPVSGDYPVDLFIYPGESQIGVVNRTSQTITFFSIDERRNAIYMNRKFITIKEPGCVLLVGLEEECV